MSNMQPREIGKRVAAWLAREANSDSSKYYAILSTRQSQKFEHASYERPKHGKHLMFFRSKIVQQTVATVKFIARAQATERKFHSRMPNECVTLNSQILQTSSSGIVTRSAGAKTEPAMSINLTAAQP
jgi:hypothetical protein